MKQTVQRFEKGQVCFAAAQSLGAAPTRHTAGLTAAVQLGDEFLDQSALSYSRFARDADQRASSCSRSVKCHLKLRKLLAPAHSLSVHFPQDQRFPARLSAFQACKHLFHLGGRGSQASVFREHRQDQPLQSVWNLWVDAAGSERVLGKDAVHNGKLGGRGEWVPPYRRLVKHQSQ